ncbi:hypothetical protein PGT21_012263 [Puccinia graminis f. sp. tritici]|uniref:Uncharacterized protein n=1 Tax=Puccinia graminis f. sp. tritici TaxID=56615 RepID=A0A5B0MKZ0_PUCGR|nr:hypothetical protein PGT21_012263 [Puccinia graminis f. sp. tritici]
MEMTHIIPKENARGLEGIRNRHRPTKHETDINQGKKNTGLNEVLINLMKEDLLSLKSEIPKIIKVANDSQKPYHRNYHGMEPLIACAEKLNSIYDLLIPCIRNLDFYLEGSDLIISPNRKSNQSTKKREFSGMKMDLELIEKNKSFKPTVNEEILQEVIIKLNNILHKLPVPSRSGPEYSALQTLIFHTVDYLYKYELITAKAYQSFCQKPGTEEYAAYNMFWEGFITLQEYVCLLQP